MGQKSWCSWPCVNWQLVSSFAENFDEKTLEEKLFENSSTVMATMINNRNEEEWVAMGAQGTESNVGGGGGWAHVPFNYSLPCLQDLLC